MTRCRSLAVVTDEARRVMLVRGWRGGELCRDAGLKPIWSAIGKGWVLDLPHLADVVAIAEYRGVELMITTKNTSLPAGGDAA